MDELLYHWHDMQLRDMLTTRLAALVAQDAEVLQVARGGLNQMLEMDEATVVPKVRPALDATIRRLARLLTPMEQVALAPTLLYHPRAARRRIGAELLNAHPELATPEMKRVLLAAYEAKRDPETLTPLSRMRGKLHDIAPTLLEAFEGLHDANGTNRTLREQASVFERLVVDHLDTAIELGQHYPAAFVYGVGRARCKQAEPYVVSAVATARHDSERIGQALVERLEHPGFEDLPALMQERMAVDELLRLGAWTLGQLQARDTLDEWARAAEVNWFERNDEEEDNEVADQG